MIQRDGYCKKVSPLKIHVTELLHLSKAWVLVKGVSTRSGHHKREPHEIAVILSSYLVQVITFRVSSLLQQVLLNLERAFMRTKDPEKAVFAHDDLIISQIILQKRLTPKQTEDLRD